MAEKYDKAKVGARIARGTDRAVYRYGPDQVIKFSSFSLILGKRMREKMRQDYATCRKYFGEYIVETTDIPTGNPREYIEIQSYVRGPQFGVAHARSGNLGKQLSEIRSAVEKMVADGHAPIDLVGHRGMLLPCFGNILVSETGSLRIIDATLLESRSVGAIGWLVAPFLPLVALRQRRLLDRFLKSEK